MGEEYGEIVEGGTICVRLSLQVFNSTPDDLDMHLVYDVSHNIAKVEDHLVDGRPRRLLVHRKGSTRAFPPHHPLIPVDYQFIGQPVLIGGSMGTCSYVLTGTERVREDGVGERLVEHNASRHAHCSSTAGHGRNVWIDVPRRGTGREQGQVQVRSGRMRIARGD